MKGCLYKEMALSRSNVRSSLNNDLFNRYEEFCLENEYYGVDVNGDSDKKKLDVFNISEFLICEGYFYPVISLCETFDRLYKKFLSLELWHTDSDAFLKAVNFVLKDSPIRKCLGKLSRRVCELSNVVNLLIDDVSEYNGGKLSCGIKDNVYKHVINDLDDQRRGVTEFFGFDHDNGVYGCDGIGIWVYKDFNSQLLCGYNVDCSYSSFNEFCSSSVFSEIGSVFTNSDRRRNIRESDSRFKATQLFSLYLDDCRMWFCCDASFDYNGIFGSEGKCYMSCRLYLSSRSGT